jgi:large subunit ribosomal protein L17
MAAASSAAEEAAADTTDAAQGGQIAAVPEVRALEREAVDAQDGTGELRSDSTIPAGAVAGNGTAICPPDYPIKGNRQSRIYHRPGQVSYPSTVAEYCFASEEAAESAGFRQSRARGQRAQSQ